MFYPMMDFFLKKSSGSSILGSGRKLKSQMPEAYKPLSQTTQELTDPYVSMRPYKEAWGQQLNSLARRGVVDSTITRDTLSKLGESYVDMGQKAKRDALLALEGLRQFGSNFDLNRYSTERNLDLSARGLAEQIRHNMFTDALNATKFKTGTQRQKWLDRVNAGLTAEKLRQGDWARKVSSYSALDQLNKGESTAQYDDMYKLWNTMISGRFATPSTTYSTRSSTNPFLTSFAQSAGNIMSDQIGNWAQKGMDYITGLFTTSNPGEGLYQGVSSQF